MALDPSKLRSLRKALNQSEDLITAFMGQTGALNKAESESAAQLSEAAKIRDAALAKAQAAYDAVESKAKAVLNAARADAARDYTVVATAQGAKVAEAAGALKDAEAALRKLQDKIRDEYGYNTNLFPSSGPTGSTIRVG
jgi:multidrug efflux pump subunit AcrA (membrane-fusion protein)